MADKTDKPERAPVNLSPPVRDKLNEFLAGLRTQEGRRATQDDLVGALLHGVPIWQADLMLRAYLRHTEDNQVDESTETGV